METFEELLRRICDEQKLDLETVVTNAAVFFYNFDKNKVPGHSLLSVEDVKLESSVNSITIIDGSGRRKVIPQESLYLDMMQFNNM